MSDTKKTQKDEVKVEKAGDGKKKSAGKESKDKVRRTKMSNTAYEKELNRLQTELVKLEQWNWHNPL